MNSSNIICLVAIALILVITFYKCPSKEGFRVAGPSAMLPDVGEVPLDMDHSPPIMALNGSNFRGYGDLVESPSLPPQHKPEKMGDYLTPQDMMPSGSMEQGTRHREDGSIPNENNVIAVNLAKNNLQLDCVSATFNIGHEVVPVVNSVHANYDNRLHYQPNSIITGTEYDHAFRQVNDFNLDYAERRLEIFRT